MTKNYKVKLTTLTPVHIGSGDVFEPTQFFMDDQANLRVFKTSDFLEILDEKKMEEFSKLCIEMNLVSLFRFFAANFKTSIPHRIIKGGQDLLASYKEVLKKGSKDSRIINQFELKRTIFNEFHQTAYIPGSSIKGSIKTAWMSKTAVDKSISDERNIKYCEPKVLGGTFSDDPFRFVKISDMFPLANISTRILYATNHSKKPDKKDDYSSLTVPFEVLMPGNSFEGKANLEIPYGLSRTSAKLPVEININSLAESSKHHYMNKLEKEEATLKLIGCDFNLSKIIRKKYADTLFKTSFPIRIGHHSGADFVTLDRNRNIKIRRGKAPAIYRSSSTTLWLASLKKKPENRTNLAPFGWAMVELEEDT